MTKTNSQKTIFSSEDALAFWIPNSKEEQAINRRSHLNKITQVDEIWELLKVQLGEVLAVDSPHTSTQKALHMKNLQKIFLWQHLLFLRSE